MTCLKSTNAATTLKKRETSVFKKTTKANLKSRNDDCTLMIKKGEIDEIRWLLTMEHVNMIDLQLFSGTSFSEPLLPHWKITFVNGDGRVLISWLDIKYLIITWTLSAGRTSYNLHVRESRNGCLQTMKNMEDFVSGSLLQQFIGSTQQTSCEVCYLKARPEEKFARRCCGIAGNDNSKYECSEDKNRNEVLRLIFLPNIPVYITGMAFLFIAIFVFRMVVQTSQTRQNDSTYYYLTESTMSICCIIRHIISDDHGQAVSKIRRFLFVFLISFVYLSHFRLHLKSEQIFLDCIFFYWAICFPFTKLLNTVIQPSDNRHDSILQGTLFTSLSKYMALYLQHDIRNLHSSDDTSLHSDYNDLLLLLSLPFNIKMWSETIRRLYSMTVKNVDILRWLNVRVCGGLPACVLLWLFTIFICLVYIPVVLVMIIILIITTITAYMYRKFKIVVHSDSKKQFVSSRYDTLRSMHEAFILILSIGFLGIALLFTWTPFYMGLLANVIYYIPYITVMSVSTFYFPQIWKSMDSKYFALKIFIYEEYQKRMSNEDPGSNGNSKKESGAIVPVVSKQLHGKIRERLLPYHIHLSYYVPDFVVILFFLGFFVYVIMVLQKYHATDVVKVLTTMSVSVLPYIFNAVVLQSSEEEKRAWNERLKLNVKRVVDELIAEDPEFARTVLTIRPHNKKTTSSDSKDSTEQDDEEGVSLCIEPADNIQYETSM